MKMDPLNLSAVFIAKFYSSTFLKWAVVAGTTFLLDLLIFFSMISAINSILINNTLSFILSSIYNFTLHRKWTFKNNSAIYKNLAAYSISVSASMIVNTILLFLLSSIYVVQISKISANFLMIPINYFLMKKLAFRS